MAGAGYHARRASRLGICRRMPATPTRADPPMLTDLHRLRTLYPAPGERALRKQLDRLDPHCVRFVALSPFVVLASADAQGRMDASPRGGPPGFVRVADAHTLLLPDAPGNNRLDTLGNLVANGRLGMLFLIPGVDETLRINGTARLTQDAQRLALFAGDKRQPRLVIEVQVEEAYLHCAKALMRSALWSDAARVERSVLPTMGQMLREQTGLDIPPETEAQMRARYAPEL
jgi:PPOX class probable FMN-dependent enzyme